jgi:hypothetical protein
MMLHRKGLRIFLLASALLGTAMLASPVAHAATIAVVNNDGPGEGFNDPTAAAPVGGNTGTTIGAQRLIAFQRAADIWGARLNSSVEIRVRAQFDPLACNATSAVLGSAGPSNFLRDFTGAPVAATWFPVALANALRGADLDPANDDINATFNSTFGTTCAFPGGWYYGLDGNPPSNRTDFVTVLLHELGHGLGFLTLVDLATGQKALGFNDVFMRNLENHGASPADYPSMSDAQRVAASKANGNLHWVGANVRAASGVLTAGRVGDHVQMYAPTIQEPGSSVSHWDKALTPNQLMEPSYTGPLQNPNLELPAFKDIGWSVSASIIAAVLPNARTTSFPGGQPVTGFATILNTGPNTATGCSIALPAGVPATLHYQTTNASNQPVGTQDTPANIGAGAGQTFVFSITPSATFSQDIALVFSCTNTSPAPVTPGVNTFLMSVGSSAITDMLSIGDTLTHDGVAHIPGVSGTGLLVTAAVDIGANGTVTCVPTPTPAGQPTRTLAANLSICQTNAGGTCINPSTPGASSTVAVTTNQTVFFSIFIQGQGQVISFDPGNKRVFLVCTQGSTPVGETSAAVCTGSVSPKTCN